MGLKFLQDIVNLDNIQFVNGSGTNAGLINMDGNDLVISNSQGDVLLGDGSADVFIGDGTNNVDIRFEQSGSITADNSNATLTIGGTGNLVVEEPTINNPTFSGAFNLGSKLTLSTSNGYILFDYEPAGDTGEYTTEVPLLKVDHNGTEKTILSRISENGGIQLGHDDSILITAGDVGNEIKANWGATNENVVLASEAGFYALAFPNNSTTWSNRNIFRFYGGDATAANNGLYIGDGGSTQFIDLDRNLKNIGAITATGDFNLTNGFYLAHNEGIRLGETGNASTSWTKLTSFTNGGNSAMKIKGGNYHHNIFFETTWNDFEYAKLNASYNGSDSNFYLYKSDSSANTVATTTISTGTSSFAGTITANSNVDVHGTLRAHGGSLLIEDTDSDDIHAQINSNSTEGVLRLRNGANWGMIARGIGNSPRLGAYHNGDLRIYGFGAADGADHADDDELARFDFANERLIVNGQISVGGNITTSSNSYIVSSRKFTARDGNGTGLFADDGTSGLSIADDGDATFTSSVTATNLISTPADASTHSLKLGRTDNSNYWYVNHAGNDFRLYNTASSGSHILFGVDSGGTVRANNVGIGTATPSEKLDVVGNIAVSGTVDGRDIATDGTKLDTIDTNADVTPSWVPSSDPSYLTAHPNISAASSVNNSGKTYIQDITLDSNGHVTGLVSDSLTGSDFIEPGSNGALNSLTCDTFNSEDSIAFNLDTDTNSTSTFVIKSDGSTLFSLNESGDLTITGKFVSTYAAKGSSGDILVDDSGEIKKRTTAELKTDLSLNNVPNTDATNASNLASGTVPTARLATTTIAKGGTGATTASGARTALGLGSAATSSTGDFAAANHNHDSDYAALSHNHSATSIVTGTLDDARISESSVTQHEAALSITEGQLPDDMPSDKVKQICTTSHNFYKNGSNQNNTYYFPFNSFNEGTNTGFYYLRTVAPYNGRIVKIVARADADLGSDTRFRVHVISNTNANFSTTPTEQVTVDMSTANTGAIGNFTSSSHFSAGDAVGVGIRFVNSTNTGNIYATVVWEYTL